MNLHLTEGSSRRGSYTRGDLAGDILLGQYAYADVSAVIAPFMVMAKDEWADTAREKGWIDEAMKGIGVDVKWTDFESGPPMNESFAAGQQDIGVIGDVPSVSAIAAGQKNVFIAAAEGGPCPLLLHAERQAFLYAIQRGRRH